MSITRVWSNEWVSEENHLLYGWNYFLSFKFSLKVKVTQSCPTLCDTMDYRVHGILQARILEWVAFPFSRGSSQPRAQTQVSCTAGRFFTTESPGKPEVKVAQPCPTLCDPMDYTVHGILQARILEWVAFPFSRGSSPPRDRTQVSRIGGRRFNLWATREAFPNTIHKDKLKMD